MTKKKTMADVWKELQTKHGDEGLHIANQDLAEDCEVISTGSIALDDALGVWGVPRGTVIHLAGAESSGKTMLSLSIIKEWQKQNPDNWALFVDAEFSFDQAWAQSLGVDLDRLMLYKENRADMIFDRLVGVPGKPNKNTGEIKKVKPGILDIEIETGGTGLGVIVLDSIANIMPHMEQYASVGKPDMALLARFLSPALRRLTPMLSKTGVTFVGINHLKQDLSVTYGNAETSPGGKSLKHASAQMINFAMINKKELCIMDGNERIGHHVRAKIQKNKKSAPYKVAEFAIEYEKGIANRHVELRDLGARYGIIERPNNRTWILKGETYSSKDAMSEALKDEELANYVLEESKKAKKNMINIGSKIKDDEEQVDDFAVDDEEQIDDE